MFIIALISSAILAVALVETGDWRCKKGSGECPTGTRIWSNAYCLSTL